MTYTEQLLFPIYGNILRLFSKKSTIFLFMYVNSVTNPVLVRLFTPTAQKVKIAGTLCDQISVTDFF